MKTRSNDRNRVVHAARSLSVVMSVIWLAFVVSGIALFAGVQAQQYRPVNINGQHIGNVELFNLEGGNGLNVRFCPVNGDVNLINAFALNWVQIVNRPSNPAYPRVDPPNNIAPYPVKNNPFYWDNWAGPNRGSIITALNYYWMQDFPTPGNGVEFETWLTRTQGNNIERLVCFNWGVTSGGGPGGQPNFINASKYNWNNALNKSRLQPFWQITTIVDVIPTATEWGLILLTVLLIVAGSVVTRRNRGLVKSES